MVKTKIEFKADATFFAVTITCLFITMLILSTPIIITEDGNSTDYFAKINYQVAKAICLNNSWDDPESGNFNISFYNNLSMKWNESSRTCTCQNYFVMSNESCNFTYWFPPRDWMGQIVINRNGTIYIFDYPKEFIWCNQSVNCTAYKYQVVDDGSKPEKV